MPPVKFDGNTFYYFADPNSFLVQHALCAQSVLTSNKGTTVLTGRAKSNSEEREKIREVSNDSGFGVGTGTLRGLKTVPEKKRGELLQTLKEDRWSRPMWAIY